jgi:hypothetical protein
MNVEAELRANRARYAADTRERMSSAVAALQAVGKTGTADIGSVTDIFDQQSRLAGEAGFEGISRLCRDMRHFLNEAPGQHTPRLAVVATRLLDVCRTIQLHADAVQRCGTPELV